MTPVLKHVKDYGNTSKIGAKAHKPLYAKNSLDIPNPSLTRLPTFRKWVQICF